MVPVLRAVHFPEGPCAYGMGADELIESHQGR